MRAASPNPYAWTVPTISRAYTPNGLNQYASVGGTSFSYDGRGNLASDGARSFSYDLENRLLSVSGSASMTLSYDPLGRLLTTTTGGATTTFLHSGDQLVAELNGSGTITARYAHGAGVDEPIVWYDGADFSTRNFLIRDNQGSIIAANGSSTVRYRYGPYGEPDDWGGARFRYTGQITLSTASSGNVALYHYKARVYDPVLGRFLQTDPVGYRSTYNLYAYTLDDPTNRADSTGATDIYIGGGGDKEWSGIVESYEASQPNTPGRTTAYFGESEGAAAANYANAHLGNGEPLNIIGHSWGADTAARVANAVNGHVDTLVGIDPVSKGMRYQPTAAQLDNVGTIVSVDARSGPSMNNAIEFVGKVLGAGIPPAFKNPDIQISVTADHGDFSAAYQSRGMSAQSAREVVDDTYH